MRPLIISERHPLLGHRHDRHFMDCPKFLPQFVRPSGCNQDTVLYKDNVSRYFENEYYLRRTVFRIKINLKPCPSE